MISPWIPVEPLGEVAFRDVRRRAIFDWNKWDPQVGDACVIARQPLVIQRAAWREVCSIAEALSAETLSAEEEITRRPELHRRLGLSRRIRSSLRAAAPAAAGTRVAARIMRFDFHFTTHGWRISEVNCDVPGGLNEASGLAYLMSHSYPWASLVGDPITEYAKAIAAATASRGVVALVHATAYSDDQQMMVAIARHLESHGLTVHLASPAHLRWRAGQAYLATDWWHGKVDVVVRFFPAEWLPGLPDAAGWTYLFAGSQTPLSNPASAILTQTKRFPLVWDLLETRVPTWRAMLPETHDPRDVQWRHSDAWVLKPAFGRAGDGVGIREAIDSRQMRRIVRLARWWPHTWIAQRRFEVVPVVAGGAKMYPCLGVYTLDGRVIGAYGRLAQRPLIDGHAADAGVLAA